MSKHKPTELSCALVRERFNYDPDTGLLTYSGREREHLYPSQRSKRAGREAGWLDTTGHVNVKINNRGYLAHRVIWLHQTGEWPSGVIDHINGEKTDNRWCNLRLGSQSINIQNLRAAYRGSASGELGVSPSATPGKWMSNIRVNRHLIRLGTYESKEAASAAYLNAKILVHPESDLVQGLDFDPAALKPTAIRNLAAAGYRVN